MLRYTYSILYFIIWLCHRFVKRRNCLSVDYAFFTFLISYMNLQDMTIEMTENLITKNVLQLENIQESANYTCQAQSTLGLVTKDVAVKVQGEFERS